MGSEEAFQRIAADLYSGAADETQTEQRAIGFRRACEVEGKNSLFVLPLESTQFKDLRMYILRCVPS